MSLFTNDLYNLHLDQDLYLFEMQIKTNKNENLERNIQTKIWKNEIKNMRQ